MTISCGIYRLVIQGPQGFCGMIKAGAVHQLKKKQSNEGVSNRQTQRQHDPTLSAVKLLGLVAWETGRVRGPFLLTQGRSSRRNWLSWAPRYRVDPFFLWLLSYHWVQMTSWWDFQVLEPLSKLFSNAEEAFTWLSKQRKLSCLCSKLNFQFLCGHRLSHGHGDALSADSSKYAPQTQNTGWNLIITLCPRHPEEGSSPQIAVLWLDGDYK